MTPYKRGDVLLVAFPFTDLTSSKMRPALVVSSDEFNRKYADIILVGITSQVPKALTEGDIPLSSEAQREAGLPKPSIVKLGKIVTLDQRLVRKKLGRISETNLKKLTTTLHEILK